MRQLFFCFILLTVALQVSAQNNYSASLIPKDLLSYASAVVRNEEITTEVKSLDNVVYHVKRAITVLNSNGDDLAHMVLFYNKSITIKYIKGTALNEYGKAIEKFNEHDFQDESAVEENTLFGDSRVKHYIPSITQYPYTLEYEFELKNKQSLAFDSWEPAPFDGLAVEKSTFHFVCDPNFNIRFKQFNLLADVSINKNKDGLKTYTWKVFNLKAHREEPLSLDGKNTQMRLLIAPEKFSFYGIEGSFTNWQQLGKWIYENLIKSRGELPAETVQYIRNLTANIQNPNLKAKKIYEYMQQKTHYVSIQMGIGGWEPFPAAEVDKDGYGDCKALVNYTHALLNAAGIESYYCTVYGDHVKKTSLQADFASLQGNHVILCIPFKNDTTWLECTNQQLPFGYLGDFTDDRTVLACTPDGGKLLRTPKFAADKNTVTRQANFTLSESGDLAGEMQTTFKGLEYDDRDPTIEKAKTEWSKDFKKYYGINNVFLKKLEYRQEKTIDPTTSEQVELSARDYGAITDGKYYFSLNSIDHTTTSIKHVRNRTNPVTIPHGRTIVDEITYTLPKGYQLDSEPLNVSIDKTFGSFTATMVIKGDQLIYTRKFQIKDGTYDKDVYQDIVDFYDAVIDADNYNVTLVKK
jgi:hypothetical protein